ncbi:hypothetical protein ABT224_36275 [Streptomyces sp. NPDC001584]|uniref:hypothetical protein n=1 Tax=Streptomyces sp. NPDC001584 TaxID=3154521 RepID=UPI00332822A8
MSGTPQRGLPMLILAAPAGITTLWILPEHHGWTWQFSGIAAAVAFLAVLFLPYLLRWLASGAKKAAKSAAKKAVSKKKTSKKDSKK